MKVVSTRETQHTTPHLSADGSRCDQVAEESRSDEHAVKQSRVTMRGQMAEEERWTDTALFCLPAAAQHSETPHHHSFSHDLMVFSGFAHTWPIFSFNFSTHHGKCVVSRFNTVLWPVYQLPNSHHRHGFKSFGTIVLPIGDDQKQLKNTFTALYPYVRLVSLDGTQEREEVRWRRERSG